MLGPGSSDLRVSGYLTSGKYVVERLVAAAMLVVFLPVMLVLMAAVSATSLWLAAVLFRCVLAGTDATSEL